MQLEKTFLLAFTLCLSCFIRTQAKVIATGQCGTFLTWEISEDSILVINGTGKMWNYENSNSWTEGSGIEYRQAIIKAWIGEGVTTIGDNAFSGCGNLTAVVIPKSVDSIGRFAFSNCANLNSVTNLNPIPQNSITMSFFANSPMLYVPDSAVNAYTEHPYWGGTEFRGIGVAVTEVHLDSSSMKLTVKNTVQLTAAIAPENASEPALIWKSRNPTIATVSQTGLVTAIDFGETLITASSENSGITAVCSVKVIPNVSLKTLSVYPGTLQPNFKPEQLEYTAYTLSEHILISGEANDKLHTVISGAIRKEEHSLTGHPDTVFTINVTSTETETVQTYTIRMVYGEAPVGIVPAGTNSVRVYHDGKKLHVDSPTAESVRIYTVGGTLLHSLEKQAGKTSVAVNNTAGSLRTQIRIVTGSSGWVRKVVSD
jgi:hypothetical protein